MGKNASQNKINETKWIHLTPFHSLNNGKGRNLPVKRRWTFGEMKGVPWLVKSPIYRKHINTQLWDNRKMTFILCCALTQTSSVNHCKSIFFLRIATRLIDCKKVCWTWDCHHIITSWNVISLAAVHKLCIRNFIELTIAWKARPGGERFVYPAI